MIEASCEEHVRQPPESVFDFVADADNEPVWNPDALSSRQVTPPPVGVGSRRSSEYKHIGHVDTEVVAYERPHRLVLHSLGRQAEMTLDFRFEPDGEGTRLLVDGRLQLKGPLRFAEVALRGSVIQQYAARARLIKQALDGKG